LSRNAINDLAIAREAQLMFSNAQGFSPIGNELNRWKGDIIINTPQGERKVPVEVFIPLKFPQYPPKIRVLTKNIQHPNIEKNGNVLLRITHDWRPDTHVFQVVQHLERLFAKVPPQFLDGTRAVKTARKKPRLQSLETAKSPQEIEMEKINKTITKLQEKIKQRDDELRKLRAQLVKGTTGGSAKEVADMDVLLFGKDKENEKLVLQAKLVALADLLSTLDEKFKDGEISPVDFAKLYRKYTKELYMVEKELEKK